MVFCNRYAFECSVSSIQLLLETGTDLVVDFTVLTSFTPNLDSAKFSL